MDLKCKAKRFATLLKLMTFTTALTSCGKENTNINESSIVSDFEIDNSGISIYDFPGADDGQVSVCDSGKETKMTDELYEEIKSRVEETTYHCLSFHLESTPIDFTNIDISKFTSLMVDCPNIDFNYNPFYNRDYEFVRIVISKNTNKENVIRFLQKINLIPNQYRIGDPYLNLEFTEDVSSSLINEYLEVVSQIEGLETFSIETSANINELNFVNIKCNRLDILHKTDKDIDYNFKVNECVNRLDLSSSYPEDFTENSSMKNLNIISNSLELDINYQIFRYANKGFSVNADNSTTIKLPNNSTFDISGISIEGIEDSWFKQFSNTSGAIVRNASDYYDAYFRYNSEEETIDDAIYDMHYDTFEEEAKSILEENGISININGYTINFNVYDNKNIALIDEKIYSYINALIRRERISEIDCGSLDKQIDFNRINLSNINWVNTSKVGYNFDYTSLSNTNRKSLSNAAIHIQKNTNHTNKINYLKNLNFNDDCFVSFVIDEEVGISTVYSYLNELDLTKVSKLQIDYLHIDKLDFSNIKVPTLNLNIAYNNPRIDYEISINEAVKEVLLNFDCDYSYADPVISKITVNSLNNDLRTYIYLSNTFANNCCLDEDSVISVPDNSKLCVTGIKEMSIADSFLEQFDNLDTFIVRDNEGNYEYNYKKNREDWEYNSKKDQTKGLLMN